MLKAAAKPAVSPPRHLFPYEATRVSFSLYCGDALDVLKAMASESIHCCVTSPPYWGLRDYGDPGQIGLERDFRTYIEHIVDVFREVRRVLRSDGTAWVNLGDSFAQAGGCGLQGATSQRVGRRNVLAQQKRETQRPPAGLKPKDLCMIPHRTAIALQEDGWWVRMDIVWAKPNAMPESVTDRPTKAHEYLFLLAKSERYFYDADAIREPHSDVSLARARRNRFATGKYAHSDPAEHGALKRGNGYGPNGDHDVVCSPGGRNSRSVWTVPTLPTPEAHFATYPITLIEPCILAGCPDGGMVLDPFAGAGTTGLAALKHGRRFIGIELNPEYCAIARKRLCDKMPLLAYEPGFTSERKEEGAGEGNVVSVSPHSVK